MSVLLAVFHLCSKPIGDVALRGEDVGVTDGTCCVDNVEEVGVSGTKFPFEGEDAMNVGFPILVELDTDSVCGERDSGNGSNEFGKDFNCKVKRDVGLRIGEEEVLCMVID